MKKNPLALPAWASRGQQQALDRLAVRGRAWAWISATGEVHGAKTQQSAAKAARAWESQVARASRGPAPHTRVVDLGSEPLPMRANGYGRVCSMDLRTGKGTTRTVQGVTIAGTFFPDWRRVKAGAYALAGHGTVEKAGRFWRGFTQEGEPVLTAAGGLDFKAIGAAFRAVQREAGFRTFRDRSTSAPRTNSRRSYKRAADRAGAAVKRAEIAAARMAMEASDIGSDAWSARGRSVAKLRFQQEVADRRAARGKIRKQAKKWVSNPAAKVKVSIEPEVNAYGLRIFRARVDLTAKNLGVWERVFSSQEAADTAVRRLKALAQKATRTSGLSYFYPTASGWFSPRAKENPYHGPLTIAHEGPDLVIRHREIINSGRKPRKQR